MLDGIAALLEQRLRARNVPLPVVYGPEPTTPTNYARERVVIEHLFQSGSIRSASKPKANPKMRMALDMPCRILVVSKSPLPNATLREHQKRCLALVDQVLVSLEAVVRGDCKGVLNLTSHRFLDKDQMGGGWERFSGSAYEILFVVPRPVMDATFIGDGSPGVGLPEVTMTGVDGDGLAIASRTKVSLGGSTPETACGGEE